MEKKSEVRNVIVFMNNFFCFILNYICVDKLLKYLDVNENVCMIMYVISLYMIVWEFCKIDGYLEVIINESVYSVGL